MSECVVRMEIPENCLKCPLRNQCKTFCDWFGTFGTSATRKPYPKPFDKGCHILTILPENHWRLGDLDKLENDMKTRKAFFGRRSDPQCLVEDALTIVPAEAESPSPKPTDLLPIRGVEYVPTEVDAQTGIVTYELRERSEKDGR